MRAKINIRPLSVAKGKLINIARQNKIKYNECMYNVISIKKNYKMREEMRVGMCRWKENERIIINIKCGGYYFR